MRSGVNVLFALIAGFAGGLLTRYIAPPAVFAQDRISLSDDVRSQSFTLADSLNRTIATFTVEPIYGPLFQAKPVHPPLPIYPPMAKSSQAVVHGPAAADPASRYPTQMRMVLRGSGGQELWSATEDLK